MKRNGPRAVKLILVGLLTAAVTAWFGAGLVATALGNLAARTGDLSHAEVHHARAADWLWVERWIGPFNLGAVQHLQGRFADAASNFTTAAELAPEEDQCAVRLAWAASLEARADELVLSGDVSSASVWYLDAEAVLAGASCPEYLTTDWEDSRDRLDEKRRGEASPPDPPQMEGEPDPEQELAERERGALEEFRAAGEEGQPVKGDGERTW